MKLLSYFADIPIGSDQYATLLFWWDDTKKKNYQPVQSENKMQKYDCII